MLAQELTFDWNILGNGRFNQELWLLHFVPLRSIKVAVKQGKTSIQSNHAFTYEYFRLFYYFHHTHSLEQSRGSAPYC